MKDLSKSFPIKGGQLLVLTSLSFEGSENEFLTIVGPSGCGKTTLIRLIAGLEQYDQGLVQLDGEAIRKPTPKIGYVAQQFSLYPWRTVRENIKFGLEIQGVKKPESDKKIESLLHLMNLKKFENFYPKDLSGGMKQKVAIARSLAIDQELLLLDEPLISLDAQTRNKLQDDLLDIWKKTKKTIILVSHNIDEAVYLSNRIIVLNPLPASIKSIVSVPLAHPRNRTSVEFNLIREEIIRLISSPQI